MQAFPLIATLLYSFTLWFGLYLLARDLQNAGLRYAGLGLISYALGLAGATLVRFSTPATAQTAFYVLPTALPAIFWVGATLHLLPKIPFSVSLNRLMSGAVMAVVVLQLASLALPPLRWIVYMLPFSLSLFALLQVWRAVRQGLPQQPLVIMLTATLFFALAVGLLALPLSWLSNEIVLFSISVDIVLLGYAIGRLDAYNEGTSLRRDALRSFLGSSLSVLLVGSQIVLATAIVGFSVPMLLLIYGVIGTLLAAIAFSDVLMGWLDELILGYDTTLTNERTKLRAVSKALPRLLERPEFAAMEPEEFARLTRRALSHYSSLDKLAASPLVYLPLVDERLQDEGADESILARANALKSVLREGIELLRPEENDAFQQTDEWRYFNALYYPYVAGVKPYSQRFDPSTLDPDAAAALAWFQTYVPERTLYNWQNTAAELVARHIRDQHQAA